MFISNHCKKLPFQIRSTNSTTTTVHHYVLLLQNAYFKSISHISESKHLSVPSPPLDSSSLCVDFLIDSCGLSQEQALLAAKKMRSVFRSEGEKPRSVITFLETSGFSKAHISKLVYKCPKLLLSDVEKTLKPKIKLFQDMGFSDSKLADFFASNPYIMNRSVENHIILTLDLVRSFVETDVNLMRTIKRSYQLLSSNTSDQMQANIVLLQEQGVPDLEIGYSIMNEPGVLLVKSEVLKEMVERIKRIGFEPESRRFTIAICVMSSMSESTWNSKMDLLEGLGWSKEQIFYSFRTSPMFLANSGKKLKEGTEFYVKNLNWDISVLSKYPHLLGFNLKRRIFPRLVVFKILMSKGIVKEEKKLISVFLLSEKDFMRRYVFKYQTQLPDLYETYKNEGIKSLES